MKVLLLIAQRRFDVLMMMMGRNVNGLNIGGFYSGTLQIR
jgi:hypothetical protein